MILVIGVIALAAGLAMVLGHNIWHGGTLPVVVTLLGWLLFIRGLVLLFLTPPQLTQLVAPLDSGAMLTISNLVALAIGLYLAYAGFAAPSRRATAS